MLEPGGTSQLIHTTEMHILTMSATEVIHLVSKLDGEG